MTVNLKLNICISTFVLRMCHYWPQSNAIVDLPISLKRNWKHVSGNLLSLSGAQTKLTGVRLCLPHKLIRQWLLINNEINNVLCSQTLPDIKKSKEACHTHHLQERQNLQHLHHHLSRRRKRHAEETLWNPLSVQHLHYQTCLMT